VDLAVVVEIFDALQGLLEDVRQPLFVHPLAEAHAPGDSHDTETGPLVHELCHQPQLIRVHKAAIATQHIFIIAESHRLHLLEDVFEARADPLQIHNFNCDERMIRERVRLPHRGEGTIAYSNLEMVISGLCWPLQRETLRILDRAETAEEGKEGQ
jgi:hypothetical protein